MIKTDVDPGAWGLFEQNEDPYGLCTECVGCESCEMTMDEVEEAAAAESGRRWMRKIEQKSDHRFPPPISCLGGGRSKFLKKERRDGRLVLMEIKMELPKVFCTSREDGRLRLELILEEEGLVPEDEDEDEDEDEEEELVPETETETETEDVTEVEMNSQWEWARSERFRRCQGKMNGEPWCHQRFVTTA